MALKFRGELDPMPLARDADAVEDADDDVTYQPISAGRAVQVNADIKAGARSKVVLDYVEMLCQRMAQNGHQLGKVLRVDNVSSWHFRRFLDANPELYKKVGEAEQHALLMAVETIEDTIIHAAPSDKALLMQCIWKKAEARLGDYTPKQQLQHTGVKVVEVLSFDPDRAQPDDSPNTV